MGVQEEAQTLKNLSELTLIVEALPRPVEKPVIITTILTITTTILTIVIIMIIVLIIVIVISVTTTTTIMIMIIIIIIIVIIGHGPSRNLCACLTNPRFGI